MNEIQLQRTLERAVSRPFDAEYEVSRFLRRRGIVLPGVIRRRSAERGSFTNPVPADKIYGNVTVGTAKASFTSEAQINDTAGMGPQAKINPYYFDANSQTSTARTLGILGRGILSTAGSAPTYTWTVRSGAAASTTTCILGGTAAITMAVSQSNVLWEYECEVQMVTPGAAGANSTVRGIGTVSSAAIPSPFVGSVWGNAAQPGTATTFDLSITNYVNFNMACGTSNASNSVQLLQLFVFGWD